MGPPEIISEHVPVPLERPPGGFRGRGGGFGRGALGPLPDDYPPPAFRLVLKDIRACIQLCTDADNAGALVTLVCNITVEMPRAPVSSNGTHALIILAVHPLPCNQQRRETQQSVCFPEGASDVASPLKT